MQKVSKSANNAGLSALAMSMVLPHEHKPIRLPVVPATLTALLDVMSDATYSVGDNTAKRIFLCRDPAYPLWVERVCTNLGFGLQCQGSLNTFTIPALLSRNLQFPVWDNCAGIVAAGAFVDGVATVSSSVCDLGVIGDAGDGTLSVFIPPGSVFQCNIFTGATGGAAGSGIEFEIIYQVGGEEFTTTLTAGTVSNGFSFTGFAGTATTLNGNIGEGLVPVGFCHIKTVRTNQITPNASANPLLFLGWCTGGTNTLPSGTATVFTPFAMPPEFNNSVLPYSRSRLNASAALFTNVSAVLSKEGTVLASRLKSSVVDPWSFTATNINSTHPSLRYYGPLEKGLYTFTTPTGSGSVFDDAWITLPNNSLFSPTTRPIFHYTDIGVYNAAIFTDLSSSATNTQLAVSCYAHIEFETTSSLFTPGVSTLPLEVLHAAEVALLRFGHFHENPLHWAAIAAAAKTALKIVAPMVAPYVRAAATHVVKQGTTYILNRMNPPNRAMKQDGFTNNKAPSHNRPKKVKVKSKGKKK